MRKTSITKIGVDKNGVIERVQTASGEVKTVKTIINEMNRGKEFQTRDAKGHVSDIHVYDNDHLRTNPDRQKCDNLQSLPKLNNN